MRSIEDFTGFPEIMDGRVKTLHPRLYAGLLARRDDDAHLRAAAEQGIEPVDLVCVNLYPFEQTVARGDAGEAEIVENIDIGGPTMIRAAAKNSAFAAVRRSDPGATTSRVLGRSCARSGAGALSLEHPRRSSRPRRLRCTARYDAAISTWFARRTYEGFPPTLARRLREGQRPALRREPPPAGRVLRARRRAHAPARGRQRSCTARSCRSTTCSTSAPRASWSRSSTGRRARSSSTTTPAAARSGETHPGGVRARLRLRSAERLRRRDRAQPARRPRVRASA